MLKIGALLLFVTYSFVQGEEGFEWHIPDKCIPAISNDGLKVLNKFRALHGSQPLTQNIILCDLAQGWAEVMAENNTNAEPITQVKTARIVIEMQDLVAPILGKMLEDLYNSAVEKYPFDDKEVGDDVPENDEHKFLSQTIWRETTDVGIGMASDNSSNHFIVIEFYPAGNHKYFMDDNVYPPQLPSVEEPTTLDDQGLTDYSIVTDTMKESHRSYSNLEELLEKTKIEILNRFEHYGENGKMNYHKSIMDHSESTHSNTNPQLKPTGGIHVFNPHPHSKVPDRHIHFAYPNPKPSGIKTEYPRLDSKFSVNRTYIHRPFISNYDKTTPPSSKEFSKSDSKPPVLHSKFFNTDPKFSVDGTLIHHQSTLDQDETTPSQLDFAYQGEKSSTSQIDLSHLDSKLSVDGKTNHHQTTLDYGKTTDSYVDDSHPDTTISASHIDFPQPEKAKNGSINYSFLRHNAQRPDSNFPELLDKIKNEIIDQIENYAMYKKEKNLNSDAFSPSFGSDDQSIDDPTFSGYMDLLKAAEDEIIEEMEYHFTVKKTET